MADWRSVLRRVATGVDSALDRVDGPIDRVRARLLGAPRPAAAVRPVAYRSYGTHERLRVMGRVLRDHPIAAAGDGDSAWANLLATYRRFESDEVPGARVRVRLGASVQVLTSDREGYFETDLPVADAGDVPDTRSWHDVDLELLPVSAEDETVLVRAPVLVPSRQAVFGIISDIDDTVIRTDATQFLRMVRGVFLGNARTRLPFPGVAAFYRALRRGPGELEVNPLFYVSSGPWNLYDLLEELFAHQGIPRGPILLRDWGIRAGRQLPTSHGPHKREAIKGILDTYPELPFVLIGDSGQEDPEIYASVMRDFPGRIHVAYIRDVHPDEQRRAAVHALAVALQAEGGTLVLTEDTLTAATHAAAAGWIDAAALSAIAGEVVEDTPPPGVSTDVTTTVGEDSSGGDSSGGAAQG